MICVESNQCYSVYIDEFNNIILNSVSVKHANRGDIIIDVVRRIRHNNNFIMTLTTAIDPFLCFLHPPTNTPLL